MIAMKHIYFYAALFCVYACVYSSNVPARNFNAVRRSPSLQRRAFELQLSLAHTEVVYIEDASHDSLIPLGARVSFKPKMPALFLDDVDHLFRHIGCDEDRIVFDFHSGDAKEQAYATWTNHSEFLVVTSTPGCAVGGAHQMYKVSSVSNAGDCLELTAEKTTIKEHSHDLRIQLDKNIHGEYGSKQTSLQRRHPSLGLKQPHPSGDSDISQTHATQNIAMSFKNKTVIPPPKGFPQIFVPNDVTLTCVDCSTTGSLELSNGDFGFDTDTDTGLSGHLDFIARGVTAHVELDLKLLPGFLGAQYIAQLPAVAIPELGLAGVGGAIGTFVIMQIVMGVEFDSTIEFSGGFELEIPDGAHIHIDVGNPGRSYDHGFIDSKLNSLPFNMHTSPPVFKFYAALQPHLQVGIVTSKTYPLDADVALGVFLNAPRMQMTIGEANHVNEKCEPTKTHPVDHSLIHVVPEVMMNVGVEAMAEVEDIAMETQTVLARTAYPLPTACLDFDPDAKSLHPAGAHQKSSTGDAVRSIGGLRGCQELLLAGLIVAMSGALAGWM